MYPPREVNFSKISQFWATLLKDYFHPDYEHYELWLSIHINWVWVLLNKIALGSICPSVSLFVLMTVCDQEEFQKILQN